VLKGKEEIMHRHVDEVEFSGQINTVSTVSELALQWA
jgi:hypothetical protein